MKKLLLLTKTLLVVALLCVGQNAWGDAVTTHSWTFTGLGSDTGVTTDGSTSLTESKTTCYLGTAPSCCTGLYFQGSWRVYSGTGTNSGIRNVDSGDRMIIVPNLKKGDIITITGNDDAIDNINTTPSSGTKDAVKKTLTFTMSADGNFYFKMVKAQTLYPAIKSIVVTHDYGKVYSADFEDAGTYASGWTIHSDLGPSQGTCTATSSKTLYMSNGAGSNRAFSYTYSDAIITNASENNYIYEFDFNYGQCNNNATSSTLTIQSNNSAKKLFTIDKQSVAWSGEFKISDSSGSVLTGTALPGGPYKNSTFPSLYHFKVEGIQNDGVYLTVTSGSSTSLARTKVAGFAPVTGLYSNMGKNMTAVAFDNIVYNIDIAPYKTRATSAISAYDAVKARVMNSTVKSTLDGAKTALDAFGDDAAIAANISGYISAISALETANGNAETSADNFVILNELIGNSKPAGYVAPSGAETKYTSNADVDPVALASAVRAAIITAGTANENTDISGLIINNSFELGTTYGWTTIASDDTGAKNNNDPYTTSGIDGSYQFNTWSKGTPITQTIGTLPEGKYKLACKVASDADNVIYLTVNESHNAGTTATGKGTYLDAEYIFSLGESTEVTIGAVGGNADGSYIAEGGKWYKADKFTITYLGEDPLEVAKKALNDEIDAATDVKNTWTPKVGSTPFKYASTYYDVLVTELSEASAVAESGSDDPDYYNTAKDELVEAEENMASSVQNTPDPDKYYQIFVANNDGTASDYNLYMLYERTKTQVTVSATPYPVKFEAITSGTYSGRYYIKTPYSHSLCCDATNQTTAYVSEAEGVSIRLAEIAISLQDNGTIKIYGTKSGAQYKYAASASEGAGVTATTSNTGTWVVSDPVDVTDVNLAVNATTGWGTFIAPYDNLTPSTVKAYTVSHKDGNIVYFEENETGVLSANTPYILSTEEVSNVSVAFKGIADNDEDTYNVNGLVGLLTASTVPSGSYILQYQAEKDGTAFYPLGSDMTGTKYRCYIDLGDVPTVNADPARATIRMTVFGGITGVANVEAAAEAKVQDGKFFKDGKLFIMKNGVKYNAAGAQIK